MAAVPLDDDASDADVAVDTCPAVPLMDLRRTWSAHMRERARLGVRLLVVVAAVACLTWLTQRHARPQTTVNGGPQGPRDIIMSQRLSQSIPVRLAGLARSEILPEALVRHSIDALHERTMPLLQTCGARFGVPAEVTLWVGATGGVAEARQIIADLQGGAGTDSVMVRILGPVGEMVVLASDTRVFWLQAGADRLDSALTQLYPQAGAPKEGR